MQSGVDQGGKFSPAKSSKIRHLSSEDSLASGKKSRDSRAETELQSWMGEAPMGRLAGPGGDEKGLSPRAGQGWKAAECSQKGRQELVSSWIFLTHTFSHPH